MLEGFYVDDLVSGGNTNEDVFELYNKAKSRMESGGFRLRKWKTNDPTLRQKICESEKDVPQQVIRVWKTKRMQIQNWFLKVEQRAKKF